MRTPTVLAVLLSLALLPHASSSEQTGVFVNVTSVQQAELHLDYVCTGRATATLTLTPLLGGPSTTRVVTGTLLGFPTVCDWVCIDECSVPFDWAFRGDDGRTFLVAGGLDGPTAAWSVQGPWEEGHLHVTTAAVGVSLCGDPCWITTEPILEPAY